MIESEAWKQLASLLGHRIIQTVCKLRSVKLTNWKSPNPPYTLGFIWRPHTETTSLASANTERSLLEWSITPALLVWTRWFSVLGEFPSALGNVSTMTSVAPSSTCLSVSAVTCKFPPRASVTKVLSFWDGLSRAKCVEEKADGLHVSITSSTAACSQHNLCLRGKEIQEEQKCASY